MSRYLALIALLLLLVLGLWFRHVGQGGLGAHEEPGTVTAATRPADIVTSRSQDVASAANELLVSRPKQILFGDLHVHTTYSFDAWGQGTRNDPFDAYRFAKGEPLGVQPYNEAGAPQRSVRLRRPLDFAMVSDHAEKLGETHICRTPGEPGYDHFTCLVARRWPKDLTI